ncbi:T9SS type A sorting domain-containing protein [uncultured Kordia sp.]|uniref:T9SS type A sorting domain-containing protein n=1 Tax=uncultured Kordia sp. TaxID=507699 RepID=UPI00261AF3D3|nr:T9SS type A sorting domain-containing protein [uncultured Kordia sp.]
MKNIQTLLSLLLFATVSVAQTNIAYDSDDATGNIQSAINSASSGDVLFIPFQGINNSWKISQIVIDGQVASNITIEMDPRVKIIRINDITTTSVSEAFSSGLFQIIGADGFTVNGNGATIQRPKSSFVSGEWAHTFTIVSSDNVTLKNLVLEESGGDGIYIGNDLGSPILEGRKDTNHNILIDNVIIDNVARNAISVVDVDGLVIKNCTLKNTGIGNNVHLADHGPWSGIDFEPNTPWHELKNINVHDNKFIANKNSGISFGLRNLRKRYKAANNVIYYFPQSLSFDINNNYIEGTTTGGREGILLTGIINSDFTGHIKFNNNTVYNTRMGVQVIDVDSTGDILIEFSNTLFEKAAMETGWATVFFKFTEREEIKINQETGEVTVIDHLYNNGGGITFNNTHVKNNISNNIVVFDIDRDQDPATSNLQYEDVNLNDFYLDTTYGIDPRATGATNGVNYFINEKILNESKNPQLVLGNFNADLRTDYLVKNTDFFKGLYLAKNSGTSFSNVFAGVENQLGGLDSATLFSSNDAKIYVGDYNDDGKDDLFVTGLRYLQDYFRVLYLSNGNDFTRIYFRNNQDIPILNSGNPKIFAGNFSGDEHSADEILIINPTHSTIKSTLLIPNNNIDVINNTTGFTVIPNPIDDANFINNITDSAHIYVGDYDGDKKLDIFIKDHTNTTFCSRYRALFTSFDGQLFEKEFDSCGREANEEIDYDLFFTSNDAKIYVGDYNGDGNDDLFVKGYERFKGLYLSEVNASGNFTGFNKFFMDDEDANATYGLDNEDFFTHVDAKVYTGDFDGNGTTDLFVNGFQNYRQLYLAEQKIVNNTTVVKFIRVFKENQETIGFSGLDNDLLFTSPHTKIFTGEFNGDGKTDLLVKGNHNFTGIYLANSFGNGFNSFVAEENEEITNGVHYDWCFDNTSPNFSRMSVLNTELINPKNKNDLLVYPNPTTGSLLIKSHFFVNHIAVYDIRGVLIKQKTIDNSDFQLNIHELPSGVYILEINGVNDTITKKIIKK